MFASFFASITTVTKALLYQWPLIMVWMGRGSHGELYFQPTHDAIQKVGKCSKIEIVLNPLDGKIKPSERALRRTHSYSRNVRVSLFAIRSRKEDGIVSIGKDVRRAPINFYTSQDCTGSPVDSIEIPPSKNRKVVPVFAKLNRAGDFIIFGEVPKASASHRRWPKTWKGEKSFGGVFASNPFSLIPLETSKITLMIPASIRTPDRPNVGECFQTTVALRDEFNNLSSNRKHSIALSATTGQFYLSPKCEAHAVTSVVFSEDQTNQKIYFQSGVPLSRAVPVTLKAFDRKNPQITGTITFNLHPYSQSNAETSFLGEFSITSAPKIMPSIALNGGAAANLNWTRSKNARSYSYFISTKNSCDSDAKDEAIYSEENRYVDHKEFNGLLQLGQQYACVFSHDDQGHTRLAENSPFLWIGGAAQPSWKALHWNDSSTSVPEPENEIVTHVGDTFYACNFQLFNTRSGRLRDPRTSGIPHFADNLLDYVKCGIFRTKDNRIFVWRDTLRGPTTKGGNDIIYEYDMGVDSWSHIPTGIDPKHSQGADMPFQVPISNETYSLYDDRLLVTWNENSGVGGYFDLENETFVSLPSGGPKGFGIRDKAGNRTRSGFSTQLIVGDNLVVCGATNKALIDKGKKSIDEYCHIYNFSKNEWRKTPPLPIAQSSVGMVAMGSNHFALWGGAVDYIPTYHLSIHTNRGAIYDLSQNTWSSIPTGGAPFQRSGMALGWTGKELFVLGGYTTNYFHNTLGGPLDFYESWNMGDGGFYNPITRAWRPILTGAPPREINLFGFNISSDRRHFPIPFESRLPGGCGIRDYPWCTNPRIHKSQWFKGRIFAHDGSYLIP